MKNSTVLLTFLCLFLVSLIPFTVFKPAMLYGESMKPTLYENSILVYPSSLDQNLTNKIVTFDTETRSICHRVIYDNGDTLITKGDNNPTYDPEIKRTQLTGIVVLALPNFFHYLYFIAVCVTALFTVTQFVITIKELEVRAW